MINKVVFGMARYKHYKGSVYEVLCEAIHSETAEKLVIYKSCNGEVFARPRDMFYEKVEVDGNIVSRFQLIED